MHDVELDNLMKVRDDLYDAMANGQVKPEGDQALQLAATLVSLAFPEYSAPERFESFTLLVGTVFGAATQRFENEV